MALERYGSTATLLIIPALVMGLWIFTRWEQLRRDDVNTHERGEHREAVVSLAGGRLHLEAIIEEDSKIRVFTLARDFSSPLAVKEQEFVGYVRALSGRTSHHITLVPDRQSSDLRGHTSQFVATLPPEAVGQDLELLIPALTFAGGTHRARLTLAPSHNIVMPQKVLNEAERKLYLAPGGKYTESDIFANGQRTASEAFVGFQARHDHDPQAGDRICPITRTKSNPDCRWVVDGQVYEFCCPPCIDEFVALAKESPTHLPRPEELIHEPR